MSFQRPRVVVSETSCRRFRDPVSLFQRPRVVVPGTSCRSFRNPVLLFQRTRVVVSGTSCRSFRNLVSLRQALTQTTTRCRGGRQHEGQNSGRIGTSQQLRRSSLTPMIPNVCPSKNKAGSDLQLTMISIIHSVSRSLSHPFKKNFCL